MTIQPSLKFNNQLGIPLGDADGIGPSALRSEISPTNSAIDWTSARSAQRSIADS